VFDFCIFFAFLLPFFAPGSTGAGWVESVSMAVMVAMVVVVMIVVIARTTTVAGFLLRKRGSVGAAHAPEDEVVPIKRARTNSER
jgi:threonine/homoserine/homoserine lactone efflux protein